MKDRTFIRLARLKSSRSRRGQGLPTPQSGPLWHGRRQWLRPRVYRPLTPSKSKSPRRIPVLGHLQLSTRHATSSFVEAKTDDSSWNGWKAVPIPANSGKTGIDTSSNRPTPPSSASSESTSPSVDSSSANSGDLDVPQTAPTIDGNPRFNGWGDDNTMGQSISVRSTSPILNAEESKEDFDDWGHPSSELAKFIDDASEDVRSGFSEDGNPDTEPNDSPATDMTQELLEEDAVDLILPEESFAVEGYRYNLPFKSNWPPLPSLYGPKYWATRVCAFLSTGVPVYYLDTSFMLNTRQQVECELRVLDAFVLTLSRETEAIDVGALLVFCPHHRSIVDNTAHISVTVITHRNWLSHHYVDPVQQWYHVYSIEEDPQNGYHGYSVGTTNRRSSNQTSLYQAATNCLGSLENGHLIEASNAIQQKAINQLPPFRPHHAFGECAIFMDAVRQLSASGWLGSDLFDQVQSLPPQLQKSIRSFAKFVRATYRAGRIKQNPAHDSVDDSAGGEAQSWTYVSGSAVNTDHNPQKSGLEEERLPWDPIDHPELFNEKQEKIGALFQNFSESLAQVKKEASPGSQTQLKRLETVLQICHSEAQTFSRQAMAIYQLVRSNTSDKRMRYQEIRRFRGQYDVLRSLVNRILQEVRILSRLDDKNVQKQIPVVNKLYAILSGRMLGQAGILKHGVEPIFKELVNHQYLSDPVRATQQGYVQESNGAGIEMERLKKAFLTLMDRLKCVEGQVLEDQEIQPNTPLWKRVEALENDRLERSSKAESSAPKSTPNNAIPAAVETQSDTLDAAAREAKQHQPIQPVERELIEYLSRASVERPLTANEHEVKGDRKENLVADSHEEVVEWNPNLHR